MRVLAEMVTSSRVTRSLSSWANSAARAVAVSSPSPDRRFCICCSSRFTYNRTNNHHRVNTIIITITSATVVNKTIKKEKMVASETRAVAW